MFLSRLITILFLIPFLTQASVVINEIMYDLEGSDSGREWVEVYNNSSSPVDLTGWKFFEANTNHALSLIQGDVNISAGGFALIVDNAEKFFVDWSNFSGTIFDSSFSLSNTGEILVIRNSDLVDIDSVSYTSELGANGDGKTLQRADGQWVANNPTPGAQNASGQSSSQSQSTSTSNIDVSQSTTVVDWPTEPQIFANAGQDKTAVAGSEVYFSGQSLGLQKEPLENARYLWNFGDGAAAENQNVKHVYKYPGEYIVVLDVSSGKYSASDKAIVKIIPNEIEIIEANQDYIKLHNGPNAELDISFWFLRAGNDLFKFPENTFIKANKDLVIDFSVSGLKAENQKAELLYPNGSMVYSYFPNVEHSVSNITVIEPESTTVVDSSPKAKEDLASDIDIDVGNLVSDNKENTQQIASVITAGQNNSWDIKKWLMIVLGVGAVSGAGFFFVRRQSFV